MSKLIKLSFLIIFLVYFHAFPQTIADIKSPQTYQFEKHGNIPVQLNSGSNSYGVNLYTFDGIYGNESFTVDLNYYGTGFVPAKKSNYVGLDWSLNFGGTISRTVRGLPDDFLPESPESSQKLYGYLEGVRNCNRDNYAIYTGNYTHLSQNSSAGIGIKCGNRAYELEPDIFKFNFSGKSGYFYIGNNGFPIISSEETGLKIDITELSSKQPKNVFNDGSKCLTKNSVIKITDGKGIQYFFGGVFENLEISYPMFSSYNNENKFTITSWNLFKIVYPNNNTIEVKYRTAAIDMTDRNFCFDRDFIQNIKEPFLLMLDQSFILKREIHATKWGYSAGNLLFDGAVRWGDGSSYSDSGTNQVQQAVKKSLPESITFNGIQIASFSYERFEKYVNHRIPSLKLSSIIFFNQVNQPIKEVGFNYYRHKDYFFLDKLKVYRKDKLSFDFIQEYSFDYYSKTQLPDDSTTALDYYGYWNGSLNGKLIPNFTYDKNTGAYSFTESIREPNVNLASASLLKSIIYPSKGKTEFEYEAHDYSEKLDRNYSSQFKNVIIPATGIAGGARVKKITNYSDIGQISTTKEYKYVKNFNPQSANVISSGILSNYYRFMLYYSGQSSNYSFEQLDIYSDNIIESGMNSSPVLYSEVAEIEKDGYRKYYFTDYKTHPDNNHHHMIYNNLNDPTVFTFKPDNVFNTFLPYSSNATKRGKIYQQEFYNSSSGKVKEIITDYSEVATMADWQNHATLSSARGNHKYIIRQYGSTFVPTKITTNDFFTAGVYSNVVEKSYRTNKPHVLSSIKITDSDGGPVYTEFGYATGSNSDMESANMVEIPLHTSQRKNGKIISQVRTQFSKNASTSNLIMPTLTTETDRITNTAVPIATYDLYDSKGNLLQYTRQDGVTITTLYGYKQTLPLIKIEGISYATLANTLGFANTNDGYLSIQAVVSSANDTSSIYEIQTLLPLLDSFRQQSSLGGYLITTYTHDPLIGVTSVTPPSGLREVYTYDRANRLTEIKQIENGAYKTIKKFQYNYK